MWSFRYTSLAATGNWTFITSHPFSYKTHYNELSIIIVSSQVPVFQRFLKKVQLFNISHAAWKWPGDEVSTILCPTLIFTWNARHLPSRVLTSTQTLFWSQYQNFHGLLWLSCGILWLYECYQLLTRYTFIMLILAVALCLLLATVSCKRISGQNFPYD